MAGNSFLLKGWTVTISAALFALAAKDSSRAFAIIALFPALSFWGLDAYYLRQDRLFRKLYDDLRLAPEESLNRIEAFSLATDRYADEIPNWFMTLWAPTILFLHGVVILAILVVIVMLS